MKKINKPKKISSVSQVLQPEKFGILKDGMFDSEIKGYILAVQCKILLGILDNKISYDSFPKRESKDGSTGLNIELDLDVLWKRFCSVSGVNTVTSCQISIGKNKTEANLMFYSDVVRFVDYIVFETAPFLD